MGLRVVGKGDSIGCVIEAHNDPDPAFRSCGLLCSSNVFLLSCHANIAFHMWRILQKLARTPPANVILFGLITTDQTVYMTAV